MNSYANILLFLCTTLFYFFVLKPKPTLENQSLNVNSNPYKYVGIYLLMVLFVQFFANIYVIVATCGGNITENMGAAAGFTFFPWILIFGCMLACIMVYPNLKSAFSDVVGYFYVSSSANKLLTSLLIDKNIQQKIDTLEQKEQMQTTADAILKLCGNMSILINQIVPQNFEEYWQILSPLMKPEYREKPTDATTLHMKQQLFDLVVSRDNVGEAMWYIYTGILVCSLVQLKMSTRGCITSPKTMEANYQAFLKDEQQVKEKQQLATSGTYTINY